MSKGLSLTRTTRKVKNELCFNIKDSVGHIIQIKQTLTEVIGRQVRISAFS